MQTKAAGTTGILNSVEIFILFLFRILSVYAQFYFILLVRVWVHLRAMPDERGCRVIQLSYLSEIEMFSK